MMQCVRRCSFICGAVLSILLLLCSCQAGAGQLILPDNVPSENTSQGKKELLAALNQEYFDQFSSPNHILYRAAMMLLKLYFCTLSSTPATTSTKRSRP